MTSIHKKEDIIFEDNHLLVLNKRAGLLTQDDSSSQESLEEIAKAWIKQRDQKKGNVFLHAIHRLDKPVSGLVLFAKTSKALSRLNQQLREDKTEKIYLAYVEGKDLPDQGTLIHYLIHGDHRAELTQESDPKGKKAILSYTVLKSGCQTTLVKIKLITGRYHQIRLQFSAISHPIVGDKKYGSKLNYVEDAIALHHTSFSIFHPITGVLMTFESHPCFALEAFLP